MSDENKILRGEELPEELRISFDFADKIFEIAKKMNISGESALFSFCIVTERTLSCFEHIDEVYPLYIKMLDARIRGRKIIDGDKSNERSD